MRVYPARVTVTGSPSGSLDLVSSTSGRVGNVDNEPLDLSKTAGQNVVMSSISLARNPLGHSLSVLEAYLCKNEDFGTEIP